MQTTGNDLTNELIREIANKCKDCRYGRGKMECPKKVCHNKQVRVNLKTIDQIQKNKEAALCQKNEKNRQDTNQSQA